MRDDKIRELVTKNPSMAVPHYLMSSYLYYDKGCCYISDGCFDWLRTVLLEHWDSIKHQHKYLIEKRELKSSSSGHYLAGKYPRITMHCAEGIMKEMKEL